MRIWVVIPVFFVLAGAVFAASPALAKKDKPIEILQEDGSKIIIEMLPGGGSRAVRVGPDGKVPEMPAPAAAAPIEIKAPPPAPEPEQPKAEPAVIRAPDAAPKEEPKKESKPKVQKARAPVVRNVKPPQPAPPRELPPDIAVTQDLAVQIALDNAPASTSFRVRPLRGEDGREVFAVLFETDSGPYEVLVDAASGEVLSSKPLAAEAQPVPPGHLARPPARPR